VPTLPAKKTLRKLTPEKELRQIERLLGDEFTSLKKARAALKEQSREVTEKTYTRHVKLAATKAATKATVSAPVTPIISGPKLPRRSIYTIYELTGSQRRTFNKAMLDDAEARRIGDGLLKPGEYWGAQIPNRYTDPRTLKTKDGQARTLRLYRTMGELFKKIAQYLEHGKTSKTAKLDFVEGVKVVRFGSQYPPNSTPESRNEQRKIESAQWTGMVDKERAQRKVRRGKVSARFKAQEKAFKKALKAANKKIAKLKKGKIK
jgi:hypothetical protein